MHLAQDLQQGDSVGTGDWEQFETDYFNQGM